MYHRTINLIKIIHYRYLNGNIHTTQFQGIPPYLTPLKYEKFPSYIHIKKVYVIHEYYVTYSWYEFAYDDDNFNIILHIPVWIWILGTFYNIMLHIHGMNLNICQHFTILCHIWEHFTIENFLQKLSYIFPVWILTFRAKLSKYLTHSRYQF